MKANIRIPRAAFGPWAEFWQVRGSSAWSHSMCYELHLILWLSKKLSKKEVCGFFFSFCKGVSAILAYVFPRPLDPGQGDICQEGKRLPEAVTRMQRWMVQFGIDGLLLTFFFWDPHFLFFFSCVKFSSTLLFSFNIVTAEFVPLPRYWQCRKVSSKMAGLPTFLKDLRK